MKEKMMPLEKVDAARPPQGRIHYTATVSALKPDDELVQAALAVLSNLMMVTNASSAEFEIGNHIDGVFRFAATHQKPVQEVCVRCLKPLEECGMCFLKSSEGKDDANG